MSILITGSAGHLGEAIARTLTAAGTPVRCLDLKASPFTHLVGSICDRDLVHQCMQGVHSVIHTATLHKPHVATHSMQQFIDTNVTGTLVLLEAALAAGVSSFVFTSSTSVFGASLVPPPDHPAAWITEDVPPIPRNIYGITKLAAENLCHLIHRKSGLPCIVLRTGRFFPDPDDDRAARERYCDDNLKINEFLHRRADIEDVVTAHLLAISKAPSLGFDRLIISATTPFTRADLPELRIDATAVVRRHCPEYEAEYRKRAWSLPRAIDRVYVNDRARAQLEWRPAYDFSSVVQRLRSNGDYRSALARAVGSKLYHAERFAEGPYPVV